MDYGSITNNLNSPRFGGISFNVEKMKNNFAQFDDNLNKNRIFAFEKNK